MSVPVSTEVLHRRLRVAAYVLAVVLVAATYYLRLALAVPFGDRPLLILFMFPILVSALLGGLGPGLLATLLAAGCVDYLLIPPRGSFVIAAGHDAAQWSMLVVNGLLVSALSEWLHRAEKRAMTQWQQLVRARDQLRESETWFKAVVESSDDAIIGKDLQGVITSWNSGAEHIFGYSAAEVIGRSIRMLFLPDRQDDELALLQLIRHGERVHHYEAERVRKDGRTITVSITISPIFDAHGRIVGASKIARDVTNLRHAEVQLRLWAESFERSQLGLAISDARTNAFITVNPAFARERGYRQEELVGQPILSLFPSDLATQVARNIAELDANDHGVFESEHVAKDGRRFPVLLDITVLRGPEGRPVNRVVYALDITERKHIEAALRESRERLQLLIDHAPAAMAMFDRDMRYLAVSRRWLDDYGLRDRDVLGRSHYEVFPEIPDAWKAVHRRGLAGEVVSADADRFDRIDGTAQWLRWKVRPWHAADGGVGGIVIFTEDISARRQAELELQESHGRLRHLASVVEQIAAVRDLSSLMEIVRHAVRELTGADGVTLVLREDGYCHYVDEDAIGPLWKGQRFPLERCISGWVMLHGQPVAIEDIYADDRIPHEAYRPTFVKSLSMVPVGRERPAAAIGCYWATRHQPTHEELELQGAVADAMSIGLSNLDLLQNLERRVTERTAELTAANQELDAFAYAVSHDLRAPLRAMSGFSQALVEDHGNTLVGEARGYLDQIVIAARKMGELVDGLLALSRSTRGQVQRAEIDLSALATRYLGTLARESPARRVNWRVAPGLKANADPRMIEAALHNLIDNAWKYTEKAAEPQIDVYAGEVDGQPGFCVADNGAGFDMDHAARLFKPFQRLHRQDEFPGIGIGLATVQRIVHRHGGMITAHGTPGRGAVFCFSLPESEPEVSP